MSWKNIMNFQPPKKVMLKTTLSKDDISCFSRVQAPSTRHPPRRAFEATFGFQVVLVSGDDKESMTASKPWVFFVTRPWWSFMQGGPKNQLQLINCWRCNKTFRQKTFKQKKTKKKKSQETLDPTEPMPRPWRGKDFHAMSVSCSVSSEFQWLKPDIVSSESLAQIHLKTNSPGKT